jgi:hypothetical protein
VLGENGVWRMWYVSGVKWVTDDQGRPRHYYHIKYAESRDGKTWKRTGVVCIDFQTPGEFAIARPCVRKEHGIYRMWYSFRGASYRLGYAESNDGISWQRHDELAGLTVSSEGWDSEMVEYPCVFPHQQKLHMLYNGNGYGKTGVGLAIEEPDLGRDQI